MNEEEFWQIVELERNADADQHVVQIVDRLAALPPSEITDFADLLAVALYALDTPAHFKTARSAGDDSFLYARCAVVLYGQETYSRVRDNPEIFAEFADADAEPLLSAAPEAFQRATRTPWTHSSPVSYELGQNEAAWNVADSSDNASPPEADPLESIWLIRSFNYLVGGPPPSAYFQESEAFLDLINNDEAWISWWRNAGRQFLMIHLYYVSDGRGRKRISVEPQEVVADIRQVDESLASLDARSQRLRARDDIASILEAVRKKLKMPALPEMPSLSR